MLTTGDVLEELGLDEQGDYDADEPMMPGRDDEFSDLEEDVYLEDIEDDDDDDEDNRVHYSSLHPPPGSFSDPSCPSGATGSTPPPSGAAGSAPSPNDAPGSGSDTLPCWSSTPTPFHPLAHRWVQRSTSQSLQLTRLSCSSPLLFSATLLSKAICMRRK